MCKKIKTGGKSIKHRKEKTMKKCEIIATALAAVAGCLFVGGVVKSIKSRNDDGNDMEVELSSYEEELAEIQALHDAEMAALEKENALAAEEHEKRMDVMQKLHDEKISKMEEIREELLANMDLCKGASPDEISYLIWRNEELLKLLHEIAIS